MARADEFVCINLREFNLTKFKYLELLDVQKAIETGRIDVLEEYLPENGR